MSVASYAAKGIARSIEQAGTCGASRELLCSLLALGCIASVCGALVLGDPTILLTLDPQLAFLLRGMAVIKAAIVLSVMGLLVWRFGHPVSNRCAAAYVFGTSVLAGASMLIWQLSFIPLAAVGFHVAAFGMLVAAWRDDGATFKLFRRGGSQSAHTDLRRPSAVISSIGSAPATPYQF